MRWGKESGHYWSSVVIPAMENAGSWCWSVAVKVDGQKKSTVLGTVQLPLHDLYFSWKLHHPNDTHSQRCKKQDTPHTRNNERPIKTHELECWPQSDFTKESLRERCHKFLFKYPNLGVDITSADIAKICLFPKFPGDNRESSKGCASVTKVLCSISRTK